MELKVRVKDGVGRWLGGLGKMLGLAGRDAEEELGDAPRPEPRDEAEEALWQAMGWDEPEGEDAGKVVARVVGEVIRDQ